MTPRQIRDKLDTLRILIIRARAYVETCHESALETITAAEDLMRELDLDLTLEEVRQHRATQPAGERDGRR